ncbi:MAG: hypothetical protein V8S20_04205 [Candidatus Gastranaerophilaceae bacterium]|jgi:hypothetical protein|nr:hypothetical protein [bacterium]CDE92669.1 unknown [Fusobacterium sp. CAG:815]DAA89877.1 MAG TPA: hypothetical protein CPT93_09570 [Candidatus Gastranaerophilales bacterium HUM_7]DAA93441.1 MAG TPA: hypothetical protein CPT79_01005 [Candidatus Gastranaerophilales bacterium HUM_6]DAB03235.1 MAG TPA: hypothetical protein CPT84_02515 [Candidatus Gastranaerophilales bacterium HUM_12]DAB05410.1 MAG TPA: hypothetical protein CPT78_07075 [Candidatus Gastranaerophilales bacterium HUM_14]
MSIGSISNSISQIPRKINQGIVNIVPEMTISNEKTLKGLKWVGEKVSSPENRLILGVTALMSQPFIDLNNKKVDEDTRKVSAARTVAKIIAGTTTGVLIRSGCIHAIDAFTKLPTEITPDMKFKKLRTLFTPSAGILKDLNQYKKSLGTILSLGVMVVTNFLLDAPLTKFLTNKFVDRINSKKEQVLQNKGVAHE